jgi:hypothetical protein
MELAKPPPLAPKRQAGNTPVKRIAPIGASERWDGALTRGESRGLRSPISREVRRPDQAPGIQRCCGLITNTLDGAPSAEDRSGIVR